MGYRIHTLVAIATLSVAVLPACNDTSFSIDSGKQAQNDEGLPPPNSTLCEVNPNAEACDRTPVVSTPGIVTILFTVSQIPKEAATLIMSNAIKYASPAANPKILFLKDSRTNGEDEGDADYIKNFLLAGYQVEYKVIADGGLTLAETNGKDLVVVSNPGHPLSDALTLDTLQRFAGGVILVGDDLTAGAGFNIESFTGLKHKSNGTSISCNGQSYKFDNLQGYEYVVTMNSEFLPGIPAEFKTYRYGNDIDHAEPAAGVQVLATAVPEPGTCSIAPIPTVVRRPKSATGN